MDGNPKAAICSDCHTTHDIQDPFLDKTQLLITKNCGSCHKEQLASYQGTYHGQVNTLGFAYTAKCFDCHGYHTIQRVNDPTLDRLSGQPPADLPEVPSRRDRGLSDASSRTPTTHDFHALSVHLDRLEIHAAALGRHLLRSSGRIRRCGSTANSATTSSTRTGRTCTAEALHNGDGKPVVYYRRWPAIWRHRASVLRHQRHHVGAHRHDAVQRRHRLGAAHQPSVRRAARHRHRASHLRRRLPRHLLLAHLLRILAHRPQLEDLPLVRPRIRWSPACTTSTTPSACSNGSSASRRSRSFDRWTYWEKFDYWAPFWGVTIIGISGAMLWFKGLTATYLPGWVFNVATIFHGEEAVLAAGFLFTVHFFNNHWRPDKFPLDILMFTGKMPLEEFKREHTVEYNRLVESGELSKYLVDAPSRPMTVGSKILGFTPDGLRPVPAGLRDSTASPSTCSEGDRAMRAINESNAGACHETSPARRVPVGGADRLLGRKHAARSKPRRIFAPARSWRTRNARPATASTARARRPAFPISPGSAAATSWRR